jgi:hypothetical protein
LFNTIFEFSRRHNRFGSQTDPSRFAVFFLAVGFPASVRARHFVELSDQLEAVFKTLVDNETRVRDEYRNNVLSLQNETEKIERALAISHVQPNKNSSLMTLFDAYNKRCEEVKSVRDTFRHPNIVCGFFPSNGY